MSALAKAAHRPPDIALILGTHKARPEDDDEESGSTGDNDQATDDAAEAMMDAIKKEDVDGFKKSLCAFLDLYHAHEDEDGDDEDTED